MNPMTPNLPEGPLGEITRALYAGHKIEAIKVYREATGAQLVDAKNAVERFEAELRAATPDKFKAPPAGKGCATTITVTSSVLIVLGFAIFLLVG